MCTLLKMEDPHGTQEQHVQFPGLASSREPVVVESLSLDRLSVHLKRRPCLLAGTAVIALAGYAESDQQSQGH